MDIQYTCGTLPASINIRPGYQLNKCSRYSSPHDRFGMKVNQVIDYNIQLLHSIQLSGIYSSQTCIKPVTVHDMGQVILF